MNRCNCRKQIDVPAYTINNSEDFPMIKKHTTNELNEYIKRSINMHTHFIVNYCVTNDNEHLLKVNRCHADKCNVQ